MRFLKSLVRITPFRVSLSITISFFLVSIIYDVRPDYVPLITAISEKSLDYKFRVRGFQKPKSKIVIVAADESSFQHFGQWPFDRATVMGPLLEAICRYNPKAVGLDIVWTDPEKPIPTGVRSALTAALGGRASLDEIIQGSSGDAGLRKAVDFCGPRIVLGYALQGEEGGEKQQAEYDKRLKQLVEPATNNTMMSRVSQGIRYAEFRGDHRSNTSFYHGAKTGLLNLPSIVGPRTAQGFFNNESDRDGHYRKVVLIYRAGNHFVPGLSLRMAQKVFNPNDAAPLVTLRDQDQGEDLSLEFDTPNGRRKIPADFYGQAVVNYRGPNRTFPNVSFSDVVSPGDTIEYDQITPEGEIKRVKVHKSEFFKDALVLVGITAVSLYDIRPRPLDATASGVENHATILDNIVSDDFLERPSADLILYMILAILVGSLFYGWVVAKLDARLGALFAVGAIGGVLYFDQVFLFNNRGIVFSGHIQIAQLLLQYLAITVLKYMREESEKKFIRSAFDKYVSPAVIESMLQDPKKLQLGGEKKDLSIMFSDIRGFTELSEKCDVKALSHFLNEYLGAMTDILQANGGTLDKYIGDAVMGFWGAPVELPNHAALAVKTAVEMMKKLEELNPEFQKKYGLTVDIGIGVNTGAASVGNFGSSKVFSYTIIGDNVNLASRLEGLNKYYGTHVIVSESTYQLLKPGEFVAREVDTVKVKGKAKPVKIYEVIPDTPVHVPLKSVLKTFNDGLMHYYAKQWEPALTFFNTVLQARDGDRPTLELIDRCKHYIANPPAQDWDGSWEMHSK